MSQQPKVIDSYQVDCPNRFTMGSPCPRKEPKSAVVTVFDDGRIELVCLYCNFAKTLKSELSGQPKG
ncbi:unnamed protein product [marine sediment metagenome]|uniref:Uncharacterized protein n=1 Tax=marine sediment metagenome TaxID=412755 RepID=X1QFJ4_9ZZZZ